MSQGQNLIMPKGDGRVESLEYSVEIYYEYKGEWLNNDIFKKKIHTKFKYQEEKDGPFLIKKSELAKYFGLIEYNYKKREARITDRGIRYHEASNKQEKIKIIFESLCNDSFGRNNKVVPKSDSDLDPPKLFIKLIYELDYITKKEFKYALYLLNDLRWELEDTLKDIILKRKSFNPSYEIAEEKENKYGDPKYVNYFEYIGLIYIQNNKYYITQVIYDEYSIEIENLSVYNTCPVLSMQLSNRIQEDLLIPIDKEDELDISDNDTTRDIPYITDTKVLQYQNNRQPELSDNYVESNKYKTNKRLSKTALYQSNYKCNISEVHETFIDKKGVQYMEGHHLVPMSAQKDLLPINLDRVENIVSLCPICHCAIHYGNEETRKSVLRKLFDKRESLLNYVGINLTFEQLFERYYQ